MRGQFSACWGSLQRWQKRWRGRDGPENGTDPSWFGGGKAFLTLGTQLAAAAIADAGCIQQPVRAIALRAAFLRIERMIGGAKQASIRLRDKSRSWKATRKRSACPLRGTIHHGGCRPADGRRLGRRHRLGSKSRSEFGGTHGSGRQVLSEFQTNIPHPLADDLPEFLPTRST